MNALKGGIGEEQIFLACNYLAARERYERADPRGPFFLARANAGAGGPGIDDDATNCSDRALFYGR